MSEVNAANSPKVDPPRQAALGAHVELELIDDVGGVEHLEVDLVPERAADLTRGFLGINTALAMAIRGKPEGVTVPYTQGDLRAVRIVRVTPSTADSSLDAAAVRRATLEQAVRKAQQTDALNFASSFSGKWGDYDPAGVEKWDKAPGAGGSPSHE